MINAGVKISILFIWARLAGIIALEEQMVIIFTKKAVVGLFH